MRFFASVPLLLGAPFFGALARPPVVDFEPVCLDQDTPQHDKRKFKKCIYQSDLTRLAILSLFSPPHEPLAENPLKPVLIDSADEFTAASSKACSDRDAKCCYTSAFKPYCATRMLILYSVYYILTYSNTFLAPFDFEKNNMRRFCERHTTAKGQKYYLYCCGYSLAGIVSHYQYRMSLDITNPYSIFATMTDREDIVLNNLCKPEKPINNFGGRRDGCREKIVGMIFDGCCILISFNSAFKYALIISI